MQTSRDKRVWKVRVLLGPHGIWSAKTFFYSRKVFADRWVTRAEIDENIKIDFYGEYVLKEEDSVA
jgi:hypothetical protein